ncbi:3-phosphoglycerate dehydrogenase [Floricoccus tropicus]|uniref:D-3-phosphoglycerate dehydrogenase n=1 Tax=Floricoccus tropicus TaxID=1859473 RepID=A0A1E8GPR5_9LACT|nr:3-phosphoglycerate dehydrogenase family protein [Floricoccus tropicus]OFI50232.1 3-phosphoglycerate dehydrogenase [Floricoccus tropicus]
MYHLKTFNAIASEGLERFDKANYSINESDNPDGIILRSQNLNDYDFPKSVLAVARAGAGTNNVPVTQCAENGIVVFNTPGANANAVKELVIASLLLSVRPMIQGANWVQTLEGDDTEKQVEANKKQFAGHELYGKKLGVIGLGSIGAMVANDAYRLGMDVMGYDPHVSVDTAWSISRRVKRAKDMSEVLKECDFITIHVPLLDSTKGLISNKELAMMKEDATLLNFSRGEIVDVDAVVSAVNDGNIAGYISDFADSRLLHNDKILVLPHLGASTEEAEVNCAKMAAATLKDFLENGNIKNSVNFPTVEMRFSSPYRLTVINKNVPNMLGVISSLIAAEDINIDNMINRGRGDFAYTIVDVNETSDEKINRIIDVLTENENIIKVRAIKD